MFDDLFLIALGFIIGFIYALYRVAKAKVEEEFFHRALEEVEEIIVDASIEEHSGFFLLYSDKGDFIAQGKTFEDLELAAKTRYPDTRFKVPQEQVRAAKYKSTSPSK